mgnify:CR=1 FL=1
MPVALQPRTMDESIDFDPNFLPPDYTETVNDVVDEHFFLFVAIVRQKSSESYLVAWHEDREYFFVSCCWRKRGVGAKGSRHATMARAGEIIRSHHCKILVTYI